MPSSLFDVSPSGIAVGLFATGWVCGWLLLCRPRGLPEGSDRRSLDVAVVVPARNEAGTIASLVSVLTGQLRDGDELLVVDDGSTDGTVDEATRAGAAVVAAGALPSGWAGKPHACAIGATRTRGDVVVFLDADVVPAAGLLDAVASAVERDPDAVVSVQPWHLPVGAVEQLSLMFNVTALMGSGAFALTGRRVRTRLAFGPVMAMRRATYEAAGGHGGPGVRGAILEDIALALVVGRSRLFVGRRGGTTFRMYPAGLRQLTEGWTKGMGIGISAAPWWAAAGTAAWVTSVAGGWLASPWFALATMVQLAVLARIAGRFSPLAVVLYPIPTAFFVAVVVRSVLRRARRAPVTWRGRALTPDQDTT